MGDCQKLDTSRPRKIAEVEWTEGGLKLPQSQRLIDSGWFLPLMATLPLAAFILIFFW
ncbi:hypothetical protein [uncultured Erythrobacter sp.]|uniref:hypothetical protein n=1 Tax=uncultured Erythrobacter sp. TaxID=263913 RepID=UPI002606206A|nr:hypothetical protein [uncultured Erythrobacter sp.]